MYVYIRVHLGTVLNMHYHAVQLLLTLVWDSGYYIVSWDRYGNIIESNIVLSHAIAGD